MDLSLFDERVVGKHRSVSSRVYVSSVVADDDVILSNALAKFDVT
jgi:hypothetical protein